MSRSPSLFPAPQDDWSSGSDGDDSDAFDLRQYRYARSNPAAATASSVVAPVAMLARRWRKAAASRATNVEGGLGGWQIQWDQWGIGLKVLVLMRMMINLEFVGYLFLYKPKGADQTPRHSMV